MAVNRTNYRSSWIVSSGSRKNAPGKNLPLEKTTPGKLSAGKLTLGKLSPRRIPPQKISPRKFAPGKFPSSGKLSPMKFFYEFFLVSNFYFYDNFPL